MLPAASATESRSGERWLLGAVSRATALALAAVLAFAAVVACLAAALAFAVVFAFTGVFGSVLGGVAQASLGSLDGIDFRAVGCRLGCYGGSTDQTGESRREKESIQLVLHFRLTSLGVGADGGIRRL